jgi:hypothetical protein
MNVDLERQRTAVSVAELTGAAGKEGWTAPASATC